jgi:hypothetical protein
VTRICESNQFPSNTAADFYEECPLQLRPDTNFGISRIE